MGQLYKPPPDYPCPIADPLMPQGVPFAKTGCLWEDVSMIQGTISASLKVEVRALRAGGLLLLAL